jgi:hypothetical protein
VMEVRTGDLGAARHVKEGLSVPKTKYGQHAARRSRDVEGGASWRAYVDGHGRVAGVEGRRGAIRVVPHGTLIDDSLFAPSRLALAVFI